MKVIVLGCVVALAAAVWAEPDLDAYNWRDGRTLTVEGRGFTRTVGPYGRLPLNRVDDLPTSVAGRWGMREHTTGVNVRFIPHASKICLRWRVVDPRAVDAFMGPTAMTGLDVYGWRPNEGWRFAANPRYFFNGDGKFCGTYELDWEPGRPCMVYLPLRSDVLLFEVGVPKGSTVEPMAPHGAKRRIVHYGTSIVHGGCCSRPGMALTCQEGRLCDLEVVNLGFSGGGRMELIMARMIAEIDAALYVVDCDWNMSVDLQKQNYEPFVRELKKLRPKTPILLCGGCTQRTEPRDQEKFARGVYEKLKAEDAAKWANLHFLGGVEMLPKDDECTFDYCHPNDYGFTFMAKVYAAKIKSMLADTTPPIRSNVSVFQMHVEDMARQRGVPVEEAVKAVRSWGVTGVDLWFDDAQLASNAKMLAGGLVPATLVVGMDLAHTNDVARREAAIAYAKCVGSPRIMLVPGHLREGEDRDAAWAAMKPNLAEFLRRTDEAGVGVDFEDFDGHTVVGSREHLRRAFAAFPSAGHALDTGNYHYWHEDVLAAQREFADRIRHVHVKDRAADDPMRSVAAGTGIIPVREVLARLDASGYSGWLTIECFGSTNMWDDVRASAAFLTRAPKAAPVASERRGHFKGTDPRAKQLRAVAKPPLRVLFVGAHPDDTDILCPAASMRLVQSGARVKWLAMTNGDRGHQFDDSAALARRRRGETQAAARITGIEEYMVSDTSDCHLAPTLEERAKMTKVIREFKPHVIVIHRTGDYHPDHRAAGQIVMDATYLSCVPLWAGEYPCEEGLVMPAVFFYMDRFTAPTPSRCDLVVGSDGELQRAAEALACHESQLYEWLPPEKGLQNVVPPATDHAARVAFAKEHWIDPVHYGQAKKYAREVAQCWPNGGAPKSVECFEVSEYCRLPSDWERKELEKAGFRFVPHDLAPREK